MKLFRSNRERMEHDLDRELHYHFDRRAQDLIQAGMSEAEARRQAAIEFGGIAQAQEEVRDTWYRQRFDNLTRDLRYSWRTLWRTPGFTATAVLSLALGIGANAAIFSLFDQVLLRRLPVPDPDRLVFLDWNGNAVGSNYGSDMMSYPLCRDLHQLHELFDGVFCRYPVSANLSTGQQPEPRAIEIVSGSYFRVLGVRPEHGRLIDDSDDQALDASPVAVVSYDYWQRNLGGKSDVIGSKILINNFPMTVIGVAPASFRGVDFAQSPALWIPATMKRHATESFDPLSRRVFWMHAFARLKPGISAEQAKAGLRPWFKAMLESDARQPEFPRLSPEQHRSFMASTLDVLPAANGRSGLRSTLRTPLYILLIGTGLLLLIACVNVASLFVARASSRTAEITTRLALGASRARITRQLLADSMLIALAGGLLSLLIAPAVSQGLSSFFVDELGARVDWRVFLFALVAVVLTGVLCGLLPALQVGRVSLVASLRESSGVATSGGIRLRKTLVTGQLAFTLILLVGAGLFLQTLDRLYGRGPGFASTKLLVFSASPGTNGYSVPEATRIMHELLEKVRAIPGVESAAIGNTQVLRGGTTSGPMTIQTRERVVTDREVHRMRVTPGFFSTLGIELLAGRDFDERDLRAPGETGYRSIIVSESFARRYFGDLNPIGHRLAMSAQPGVTPTIEIIGVVRGFSRRTMRDYRNDIEQAFIPYWDGATDGGAFYVRARTTPESLITSIRAAVAEVDQRLPVVNLTTLDGLIEQSLVTERILATLSTGFGVLALLLSIVGLYGVMSFVVTQRAREIGIRMALGAKRSSAIGLLLRDASQMIVAGVLVALPSVWALSRLVESQLFGIGALDAVNIAGAIAVLVVVVALGGALLPAWRAASVSPVRALRQE
jgi:predicted permease